MGLNVTLTAEDIPHAGAFAPFLKLPLCRALLPTRRFRLIPERRLPQRWKDIGIGDTHRHPRGAGLAQIVHRGPKSSEQRIDLALHISLAGPENGAAISVVVAHRLRGPARGGRRGG